MSARRGPWIQAWLGASALLVSSLVGLWALTSRAALPPADFTFVNGAEPATLDPIGATGVPEGRLLRAIYEGLCVLDPATLEPRPGMAESFEVSPDELTYTFRVRAGSRWTNGREVTAFDFRDGFARLLDPREAAEYAYLLFAVRGARAYATEVDERGAPRHAFDTVAIHAPDARTLRIELERPVPWFLYLTAYPPLSPLERVAYDEAPARFGSAWRSTRLRPENLVTNGPWRVLERRVNDRIRLVKNPGYWDADAIAFDTIDVLANEHLSTNLNLYLTGAAGFVNEVPASLIPALAGRADWRPTPYLASCFYRVNVTRPPLDDARVRRALALCIDRAEIVHKVTRAGEPVLESLVPPAMTSVTGYEPPSFRARAGERAGTDAAARFERDVAEARALMLEAGYGPDRPAPRAIEIHYSTQTTNKDVAEVVAHGWKKHLGLDVVLVNQERKVALDTQRRLDYDVSRSSWIADYPDPASFLEVFTSASENNRTGWKNARYDALLESALNARGGERARLYAEAEALLLAEMPILPLFGFTTTGLVDPNLDGFHPNAVDVHFPKFWKKRASAAGAR